MHETRSGEWSPGLTAGEYETLFAIAEATLAACVKGDDIDLETFTITDHLREPYATFVTLKENGMLRGCIGSLEPECALYESIHDNAINAARRDPRFPPVHERELPLLEVHLSILSPIEPIASLDEFRVGEHGIILEKGWARAVFLPEVAPEQGWGVEETLTALSQKAGLSRDAWRKGASFSIFSSVQLARDS